MRDALVAKYLDWKVATTNLSDAEKQLVAEQEKVWKVLSNTITSVLDKYKIKLFDEFEIIATDNSLPDKIKNSFLDNYYYTGITKNEVSGIYRRFGGNAEQAKLFGGFASTEALLSRDELAILKQWSNMRFEAELYIEKGATISMGKIASQGTYSGGATQLEFSKYNPYDPSNTNNLWKQYLKESGSINGGTNRSYYKLLE